MNQKLKHHEGCEGEVSSEWLENGLWSLATLNQLWWVFGKQD